ncbi:hypothetical protein BC936DRAFT_138453, partial [Jimgerdemannia flammicorona]
MDPQHPQDLPYPATADHPMGPVPIPEDTEHHPMALDHQPPPPGLENTQPLSTPPTNGPGPDAPPYRQHQLFSNQLPPQMPQVRRKPKRSAQPLHLLLQDAGRQVRNAVGDNACDSSDVFGHVDNVITCRADAFSEILALPASDDPTSAAVHRQQSGQKNRGRDHRTLPGQEEVVRGSTDLLYRYRIDLGARPDTGGTRRAREGGAQGCEPRFGGERPLCVFLVVRVLIIKLRFEEFQAVNRSFEDAIADLRYEHGEKADQQQKGQEGGEEKVAMVMEGFPEGASAVLQIVAIFRLWDQSNRRDAPEGSPASDRPYRNTRPERGNRGGSRGGGPPPPRHSPYQGPPSGYRGGRDFSGYPPRERDYRDRREREDPYYRDRRYDDRRDYD